MPGRAAWGRAVLRAPVSARTRREVGYQVRALLLAPVGLLVVVLLLLGVVLSLTFLGLPVVALALTCARGLGRVHRRLARRLLGVPVPDPAPRPRGRGPVDGLLRTLSDPAGWGAIGFLLVQAPLAVLGLGAPLAVLSVAVDAVAVTTAGTPGWVGTVLALLVLVFAGPWLLRLAVLVQAALVRATSGLDPDSDRLRRSRSAVLEGSAAEVRAIERNLHDGTQARLTAIALHVDLARDRLRADPERAGELLDVAHATTREAIGELRTIIRGIHPPALDEGLGPALTTLAEQAGLPVEADVDLRGVALSPAIETMAYFCVAELLANATRHAGAERAWLRVRATRRRLRLEVGDDGRGGADPGRGSGLRGLTERVAAVDGSLRLDSPAGRGTRVHLDLPVRA